MGCCCCKFPDIEELKKDPSVQACLRTTSFATVTSYKSRPNVAFKVIINYGGGEVVFIREGQLGYMYTSCCSCFQGEFPLKDMVKYIPVKNQHVTPNGPLSLMYVDNGVSITFQETEDKFTNIVFSSPEADEFLDVLSRNAPSQETLLKGGASSVRPTC